MISWKKKKMRTRARSFDLRARIRKREWDVNRSGTVFLARGVDDGVLFVLFSLWAPAPVLEKEAPMSHGGTTTRGTPWRTRGQWFSIRLYRFVMGVSWFHQRGERRERERKKTASPKRCVRIPYFHANSARRFPSRNIRFNLRRAEDTFWRAGCSLSPTVSSLFMLHFFVTSRRNPVYTHVCFASSYRNAI